MSYSNVTDHQKATWSVIIQRCHTTKWLFVIQQHAWSSYRAVTNCHKLTWLLIIQQHDWSLYSNVSVKYDWSSYSIVTVNEKHNYRNVNNHDSVIEQQTACHRGVWLITIEQCKPYIKMIHYYTGKWLIIRDKCDCSSYRIRLLNHGTNSHTALCLIHMQLHEC